MAQVQIPTQAALLDVANQDRAGALVIGWDDGWASWVTDIMPMAAERRQKHTFGFQTNGIGTANRMSAAEILEMFQAGHEIASHTVTHANATTLTGAQADTEFGDSLDALEAIVGEGNVRNFIYPVGARNLTSDRQLYGRYRNVWSSGSSRAITPRNRADGFVLRRRQWTPTSHSEILEDVRQAAEDAVLVPIYMHSPQERAQAEGLTSWAGEPTLAQVTELFNLAFDLGVPCLTTQEAYRTAGLVNFDFESGDALGWLDAFTVGDMIKEVVTDAPPVGIHGTKSLKVSTTANAKSGAVAQYVPVEAGRSYTFSILYHQYTIGTDAGSAQIRVRPYKWDDTPLADYTTTALTASATGVDTGWLTASVDYEAPADAAGCRVDFGVFNRYADLYIARAHFGPREFGAFA